MCGVVGGGIEANGELDLVAGASYIGNMCRARSLRKEGLRFDMTRVTIKVPKRVTQV